jgi:hypothetical protein
MPRPRSRKQLVSDPNYQRLRRETLELLSGRNGREFTAAAQSAA